MFLSGNLNYWIVVDRNGIPTTTLLEMNVNMPAIDSSNNFN